MFSRAGEDSSARWTEALAEVRKAFKGSGGAIFDAEMVAYDRSRMAPLPFQVLSRRGADVCCVLFDALYLGGEDLTALPLRERRERLRGAVEEAPGRVALAAGLEASWAAGGLAGAAALCEAEMARARAACCEGLMLKGLGGAYEAGRRGSSWRKLKRDYVEGLADSVDLVPIGAWHGRGRKAGWLSPLLLAARDRRGGRWQSVCRVMSGIGDEMYRERTAFYSGDRVLPPDRKPEAYDTRERCAVWFREPQEVWEVRGADLTLSPVHACARGRVPGAPGERGVALRFPRLVRVRPDKAVADASDADFVLQMYLRQPAVAAGGGEEGSGEEGWGEEGEEGGEEGGADGGG